jgi:hypothetical protein
VVSLPGLPEKGDLTDWLKAGHTKEEFFGLVAATEPYSKPYEEPWPEPKPVEAKLPEVFPLDGEMVPEPLRRWVLDTSKRMDNAPPDFAAAAAVVVCGALIGRSVGMRPKKRDGWTVIRQQQSGYSTSLDERGGQPQGLRPRLCGRQQRVQGEAHH